MRKKLATGLLGFFILAVAVLLTPVTAHVSDIEWLGRLSALGGAEKENVYRPNSTAGGARGHFTGEAMLVAPVPFIPPLGIQVATAIVAANGFRWGVNGGPVFDFGAGKAGLLFDYQYRHYDGRCGSNDIDLHGAWVRPAVSFYLPQTNVDFWVSQGISPRHNVNACEGDRRKVFIPVNEAQAMVNFFPPVPIMGRDNLEVSIGVRVQNLWGASRNAIGVQNIGAVSVGPAAGIAVMPWQNLEVTLVRGWYDVNHSKYKVNSGIQYYFNLGKTPNPSLLALRRKYLEPTLEPGTMATFWNRN